jgi:hypothetical protein
MHDTHARQQEEEHLFCGTGAERISELLFFALISSYQHNLNALHPLRLLFSRGCNEEKADTALTNHPKGSHCCLGTDERGQPNEWY